MLRLVALLIVCFALAGCASPVSAVRASNTGAIVLKIRELDVEYRDTNLPIDCANCSSPGFWIKYHARVRKVIHGAWVQPDVEFAFRNDRAELFTAKCDVVIRPANQQLQAKLNVRFVADKLCNEVSFDLGNPRFKP